MHFNPRHRRRPRRNRRKYVTKTRVPSPLPPHQNPMMTILLWTGHK